MNDSAYRKALDFAVTLLRQGDNGDVTHVNSIGALVVEELARGNDVPQHLLDALVRGECCTPDLNALETRLL